MSRMITIDELYLRDSGICGICGKHVMRKQANRDHIIPVSLGGKNASSNLQLTHIECNNKKGNGYTRTEWLLLLSEKHDKQCVLCPEKLNERSIVTTFRGLICHKACVTRFFTQLDRNCFIAVS
jgi:hypothetical protein